MILYKLIVTIIVYCLLLGDQCQTLHWSRLDSNQEPLALRYKALTIRPQDLVVSMVGTNPHVQLSSCTCNLMLL